MVLAYVDQLYLVEALVVRPYDAHVPLDAAAQMLHFYRYDVYVNELILLAVCSVKFCFLFFFRELIWRFPRYVKVWWWVVLAFTILTTAYTIGASAFTCVEEQFGQKGTFAAQILRTGSLSLSVSFQTLFTHFLTLPSCIFCRSFSILAVVAPDQTGHSCTWATSSCSTALNILKISSAMLKPHFLQKAIHNRIHADGGRHSQ